LPEEKLAYYPSPTSVVAVAAAAAAQAAQAAAMPHRPHSFYPPDEEDEPEDDDDDCTTPQQQPPYPPQQRGRVHHKLNLALHRYTNNNNLEQLVSHFFQLRLGVVEIVNPTASYLISPSAGSMSFSSITM
jgi:hypothetical protein